MTREETVSLLECIAISIGHRRRLYQNRFWSLNDHDWEDMGQDIILKVWQKHHFYDPLRPLQAWTNVLVNRFFVNWLRDHVFFHGKAAEWQRKILHAKPFLTTLIQRDLDEEIIYEPDIIDPLTITPNLDFEDFENRLTDGERNALSLREKGFNWQEVARKMGYRPGSAAFMSHNLKRKYREALND